MNLMANITSPEIMQQAWQWLNKRRGDSYFNNDYWHLRFHKETMMPTIIDEL
jgi:hypothetical protein